MSEKSFFGLEQKTVVITGGSGGVGQACARIFTEQAGAKVALLSRRGSDDLAQSLTQAGAEVRSYAVDVTDREAVAATFEKIVTDLGPVYSLLNVSGTCDFYPADSDPLERTAVDDERWDRIITVNGKGVALAINNAVQSMPSGGSIVNVASTAGRYGAEVAVIDYTFSKAGLNGMTMGYAKILGSRGIRVNGVAPGPIAGTEMLAQADDAAVAAMEAQTKLGRLCTPDDVAKTCLYLASNMSGFTTGVTVDVNGGQYISA